MREEAVWVTYFGDDSIVSLRVTGKGVIIEYESGRMDVYVNVKMSKDMTNRYSNFGGRGL